MRRIRRKLNSQGFTILEVVIGMVIFSIGLLTLLSMVVISISGNAWSDKTTKTVQMTRECIEALKNTSIDDLESYGYREENGILICWYVEDAGEDANLKQASVYLYWHDEFGRPQYTSTQTYFQPKQ